MGVSDKLIREGSMIESQLSLIEFIPPPWSEGEFPQEFVGVAEVAAFCRSGDCNCLPENPSIGIALEWICRIARPGGFERQLARLGTDHQSVMDQVLLPAEQWTVTHLENFHPLILMHCLWRISVQYGRDHCPDMTALIDEGDGFPTRHFWRSFLNGVKAPDSGLVFLPSGTFPDWGREVTLGNRNLDLDPRRMSPGVAKAISQADFSHLPEEADWSDISDVALLIDGYTVGEGLSEVGDLFEWFSPLWEAHLNDGAALPHSSLHLWLMLFACQRGYLRDRWDAENPDGSPSIFAIGIRNVYRAFRLAVQDEQGNPDLGTPVYIPERGRE
jgi:hypothetical protein